MVGRPRQQLSINYANHTMPSAGAIIGANRRFAPEEQSFPSTEKANQYEKNKD
jgi:hypothetical protein